MDPPESSGEARRRAVTTIKSSGRAPPFVLLLTMLGIALGNACGDGPVDPSGDTDVVSIQIVWSVDTLRAIGATLDLVATAKDADGQKVAGVTLTWSSSNVNVAAVSSSGVVTAVGNGACLITVTSGSLSASGMLVVQQSVSAVAVTPSPTALLPTETVQMTASVTDANGHSISGAVVTWHSSDVGVATVDAGGLVTAMAPGTATITATVDAASGAATVTALSQSVALIHDALTDQFAQALIDAVAANTATDLRTVLNEAVLAIAEGNNAALRDALTAAQSAVMNGDPSDAATLAVLNLFLEYAEILLPQPVSALCEGAGCSAPESAKENEVRNR